MSGWVKLGENENGKSSFYETFLGILDPEILTFLASEKMVPVS